jgi:hypothetical protein
MAGSGFRLSHDGVTCLESASGGASPIGGTLYFNPQDTTTPLVALETDSGGQLVTVCGEAASSPRYPYAGDEACAAWPTDPMNFQCDQIIPGSCASSSSAH